MEAIKEIQLGRGFVAIIDAHLWERSLTYTRRNGRSAILRPSSLSWTAQKNRNDWYAVAGCTIESEKWIVPLHRLLTECPAHLLVDHRDTDTMNDRLTNLRCCTIRQNTMNAGRVHAGTSKYRGVRLIKGKRGDRWQAQIHWHDGEKKRCYFVGHFDTEEEAAIARDAAALKYHGEFARLNFPVEAVA